MAENVGAVIVAAGSGQRFGTGDRPKQFLELQGVPILRRALGSLLPGDRIAHTVLVLAEAYAGDPPAWIRELDVQVVAGGATRSDSVRQGLASLPRDVATVLIHDGARPLLRPQLVERVLDAAGADNAVIPGIPVTDTLKAADRGGTVLRTVDRAGLWSVQTPQAFPLARLMEFHDRAAAEGFQPTDDAGLFERYGVPVRIVHGDPFNLKVTTPVDLYLAEAFLVADVGP